MLTLLLDAGADYKLCLPPPPPPAPSAQCVNEGPVRQGRGKARRRVEVGAGEVRYAHVARAQGHEECAQALEVRYIQGVHVCVLCCMMSTVLSEKGSATEEPSTHRFHRIVRLTSVGLFCVWCVGVW